MQEVKREERGKQGQLAEEGRGGEGFSSYQFNTRALADSCSPLRAMLCSMSENISS